jgi:hypothetical protein
MWGDPVDRGIAVTLFSAAILGIALWNQTRERPAARVFGLAAGVCFVLAVAGLLWELPKGFETDRLMVPALGFAVFPAVHVLSTCVRFLGSWLGGNARVALVGSGALMVVGLMAPEAISNVARRYQGTSPLRIGLGPSQQVLIDTLTTQTNPEARILWEDRPGRVAASQWTPLLPIVTGRAFLGGLDPDATVEHTYARLSGEKLAGRPLAEWSDAELGDFCRRYNVSWVVCWSPAAKARFGAWREAHWTAAIEDEEPGSLFTLPAHSFALQGQATLVRADSQHLALADLVPENGKVVLSFHYQAGVKVSPNRVQIEREPDPFDPIPFIRLSMPGPVARVTLTWQKERTTLLRHEGSER